MFRRFRAPTDPVTITFDGEALLAERGEPVCVALLAAGKATIARSPKFHRPRGPSCLRAACDGCLARVDDTPNVMTCAVRATEGTAVVTQNRLGPREADLLRVTDWFFPEGMNHHELFAGVPGVQQVMQAFARRIAGLGKLPAAEVPRRPGARRTADVVIVGSGPSGMAVANELAAGGREVEVLDDQLVHGGGARALAPLDAAAFVAIRTTFDEHVASGRVTLRCETVAGGLYGRDLLVVGPEGASVVEAETLVLACGGHDGAPAFEGNDVPGVMSARAAGLVLARGVAPSGRVAIVVTEGGGPFGASYARAAREVGVAATLVHAEPLRVTGSSHVTSVVVRAAEDDREREIEADLVLIDAPRSPAYELATQAGAEVLHSPAGFLVRTDPAGFVAPGIYAVGEMRGTPFEAAAFAAEARNLAHRVLLPS